MGSKRTSGGYEICFESVTNIYLRGAAQYSLSWRNVLEEVVGVAHFANLAVVDCRQAPIGPSRRAFPRTFCAEAAPLQLLLLDQHDSDGAHDNQPWPRKSATPGIREDAASRRTMHDGNAVG